MKPTVSAILGFVAVAAAVPDPLITPLAKLGKRQSDPALLGYVSESGASSFSDARSCDYPATLSSSGSLAQCCSGSSCVFWSACSAGTLFAQSTSLRCDQGFCNTAVLVSTPGASNGESYLGCWATSLGEAKFTIVRDVGGAVATKTGEVSASENVSVSGSSAASGTRTSARSSATASGSAVSSASAAGSATQSSTGAAQSTGAGVVRAAQPLTGVVGMVALLVGML